ncbi:putative carbohydrate kinase, thermoresistant glucokinase [Helianthus debilis subsp. tardiflorus]
MKKGIPLLDEDRAPWLEVLQDVVNANLQYREILRSADPNYRVGTYDLCVVKFVQLDVGVNVLMDRVQKRATEGKHFMSVELLQSQIDLLQVDESEGILKVDASLIPEAIVDGIKGWLFLS